MCDILLYANSQQYLPGQLTQILSHVIGRDFHLDQSHDLRSVSTA